MPVVTQSISDAVFRALTESAPDGIVLVNQEGRIILVNERTERLFGFQREELLGQPVEVLVPTRSGENIVAIAPASWAIRKSGPWERAWSCSACARMARNFRLKSASARS
jgi:PAS domain-containing protein